MVPLANASGFQENCLSRLAKGGAIRIKNTEQWLRPGLAVGATDPAEKAVAANSINAVPTASGSRYHRCHASAD